MAGHNKKNVKDKYKVKKPTIKEQTLHFRGQLVPLVIDQKKKSVYRDYSRAVTVNCRLDNNKEKPYDAMVRQYGHLRKKGNVLVPMVHQLGKRDDVVQSAAMFKENETDENLALAGSRLTRDL